MRNISDEQANEIALQVVIDHFRAGIEFIDIVEAVDDTFLEDEEEATDGDYKATDSQVIHILNNLILQLEQEQ